MWRFKTCSDSGGTPLLRSLNDNQGRLIWEFDPDAGSAGERQRVGELQRAFTANRHRQQHSSDELLRLQSSRQGATSTSRRQGAAEDVDDVLRAGIGFYQTLQQQEGLFPGDYGGPMFLMPGLVIALYVSRALDSVLGPNHRVEMLRYLRNHQNPDGGFGLHIEGHSTMFGTALKCAMNLRGGTLRLSCCCLTLLSCSAAM